MRLTGLDMCRVREMFNPLHEADLSVFCQIADGIVSERTKLQPHWIKRLRKLNDITQEELSEMNGVPLRLITALSPRPRGRRAVVASSCPYMDSRDGSISDNLHTRR